MIIGVDPGITTGIAILDSSGNILDIYSKRDMTRAEIIRRILRFGNPVIVSSDVHVVPKSVGKIAVKLGCITYSPDESLSLNEKRELTKDYYNSVKNDHEIDALSSAIKAWRHYRKLFSKVYEDVKKFDRQEIFSSIMLKVLKGSPNIEDAIREYIGEEKLSTAIEKVPEENTQRNLIEKLQKKLTEKQQLIDSLQNQNILLSKSLNEIRKELSKLKDSRIEIEGNEDYRDLGKALDNIKKLRNMESKGYYPVIEIVNVGVDLLEQMNERIDLENRVVLVPGNENLTLLNDKNIKCLLTFEKLADSDIEKLEFPAVQMDEGDMENFDDIKAVKIDYIEKRLADAKKSGLIGWLKRYQKRKD